MLVPWFIPRTYFSYSLVLSGEFTREKIVRVWILERSCKACSEWWENSSYGKLRLRPHFSSRKSFLSERLLPLRWSSLPPETFLHPPPNPLLFHLIRDTQLYLNPKAGRIKHLHTSWGTFWSDCPCPCCSIHWVYLKLKNLKLTGKHSALQSFPYKDTI